MPKGHRGGADRRAGAGRAEPAAPLGILYWLSVGILALILHSSHPLNSDEGLVLNGAWQLTAGKRMYADFVEYVTPGAAYATYALWALLGTPSYLAAKLLAIAFWILSAAGLARLTAIVAGGWAPGLAVLLWLFAGRAYPLINHNTYSSFAAVWCAWMLLRGAGTHRARDYGLAGAGAGLVFLFLQTKGLLLLGAVMLVAASLGEGSLGKRAARAGGALLGFAAIVAPLSGAWSPGVLLHHWFVYPLTAGYLQQNHVSPGTAVIEVLLVAAMVGVAWWTRSLAAAVLTVFQAALVASHAYMVDLGHLAINAFPAIVVLGLVVDRLLPRRLARLPAPTWVAAALAVTVPLWLVSAPGQAFFRGSIFYLDVLGHPRGDVFDHPVVRKARHIYAGPFLPGLYFELRKPNPFFVSNMLLCRSDCQARIRDTLARVRPEVVFLHYGISDRFAYDRNNPADTYIRATYRPCPDVYYPRLRVFVLDTCP
jgi:hypothetical protein